jgi:ABC-type sugar transport system ATPase subunit
MSTWHSNSWRGSFVVKPLGDSAVATVDVADTRMQVVANPDFKAAPKQSVWLSFEPEHIRLFDDATGKATVSESMPS